MAVPSACTSKQATLVAGGFNKQTHGKMDGENNGKPYEQMDDLGENPYFWKHPYKKVENLVPTQNSKAWHWTLCIFPIILLPISKTFPIASTFNNLWGFRTTARVRVAAELLPQSLNVNWTG